MCRENTTGAGRLGLQGFHAICTCLKRVVVEFEGMTWFQIRIVGGGPAWVDSRRKPAERSSCLQTVRLWGVVTPWA